VFLRVVVISIDQFIRSSEIYLIHVYISVPRACQDKPCVNGGTCVESIDDNYECLCPPAFTGANCQSKGSNFKAM